MVNTILVPVAVAIVSVLVGGCAGYSIRKNKWETQAQNAAHDAKHILADAESKAKAVEADLASQKEAMKKAAADAKKEKFWKHKKKFIIIAKEWIMNLMNDVKRFLDKKIAYCNVKMLLIIKIVCWIKRFTTHTERKPN